LKHSQQTGQPMTRKISAIEMNGMFLNAPLMVSDSYLIALTGALKTGSGFFEFEDEEVESTGKIDSLAVLNVFGGLTHRGYWGTSYEAIRYAFNQALKDETISAILFNLSSPGGVVSGVFDLADEIFQARKIKSIFAISNEFATSAAYLIGAAAGKFFSTRTAATGSIGVRAVHVDFSKMNEQMGLKFTTVYAGSHKNDFDPESPISKQALKAMTESVNKTNDLFINTVAKYRKIDPQTVRDMQAAIYEGEDAKAIGLVDRVMSFKEAIQEITKPKKQKENNIMNLNDLKTGLTQFLSGDLKAETELALKNLGYEPKKDPVIMPDVDKIKAESEATGKLAGVEEGKAEGAKLALETATGIMDLCLVDGKPDLAIDLIKSGVTLEGAREKLLALKADADKTADIKSTVGALSTGSINPLITDALRRKEEAAAQRLNK